MATTQYEFLDSPREREWLTTLEPQVVLDNAHRFYDFMNEQDGISEDSFLRELAFTKASEALSIDYDVLYDAWVNETPAPSGV